MNRSLWLLVLLFFVPPQAQAQSTDRGCIYIPTLEYSIEHLIHGSGDYAHDVIGSRFQLGASPEQRAQGLYGQGLLYHLAGKLDLAIVSYSAAIGWNRNFGDAYEARGDAYAGEQWPEKATADYAEAARLASDGPDDLAERCWVRAVRGRPLDRALADCNEALKQNPDDKDVLDSRCLVYFKMRNFAAAVADCTKVENMQKRFAPSLYVGGLAKLCMGNKAAGDADIAAALDADYRIADTYALYGVTR